MESLSPYAERNGHDTMTIHKRRLSTNIAFIVLHVTPRCASQSSTLESDGMICAPRVEGDRRICGQLERGIDNSDSRCEDMTGTIRYILLMRHALVGIIK